MRDLNTLRLHNAPGVAVIFGRTAAALDGADVSPRIGFPYLLDHLAVTVADVPAAHRMGLDIYISDDNDVSDLTNLTGDRLWTATLDLQGGEPRIPMWNYTHPLELEPARLVRRAPTYLKARWRSPLGGAAYAIIAHLVPLGPGD